MQQRHRERQTGLILTGLDKWHAHKTIQDNRENTGINSNQLPNMDPI